MLYIPESAVWTLSEKSDSMKVFTRIVNLIRGGNRAHRQRKFISFLDELDSNIKISAPPLNSRPYVGIDMCVLLLLLFS